MLQKAIQAREVTPEPVASTSVNEKASVPSVPQIKIEPLDDPPEKKPRAPRRKPIKVESSPDRRQGDDPQVDVVVHKSPRKRTPIKEEWVEGWEPVNWRPMLENIRRMRLERPAPVDSMGCDQFRDDVTVPPKTRRFHTLVSLMLSSQTKDQANFECMQRLRKHGLTPEQMVATDVETLEKLIHPVSFYKVGEVKLIFRGHTQYILFLKTTQHHLPISSHILALFGQNIACQTLQVVQAELLDFSIKVLHKNVG